MPRILRLFFTHNTQYLPKEELYAPPLNIRILDKRSFGRMPLVGTHIIKSLKDFHVEPVLSAEQKAAVQGEEEGGEDFWHRITAKFYSQQVGRKEGKGEKEKKRGGRRRGRKKGRERVEEGGREGTTFSGFYLHSLASVGSHWMTCK